MTRYLVDQDPHREHRRQLRIQLILERTFTGRFAREIGAESLRLVEGYRQTGTVLPVSNTHIERLTAIEFQMAEATARLIGGRVLAQGKASGQIIETKFDFASFFNNIAMAWIGDEAVRQNIVGISETTRNQIVSLVENGAEEGLGTEEVAGNITKALPAISKARGATIARTEIGSAAENGSIAAAKETGLMLEKQWLSVTDSRSRPEHAAMNGVIVGMDEVFDVDGVAMKHPKDPAGGAKNIINCRCTTAFIVIDPFIAALDAEPA
jgi:SPP1 gp7 family putative phage head morphogenesis protein